MCKLGDIVIIKEFKNEVGQLVKKHSFVVINDEHNRIEGMNYDFVANMICSFHNDEHKTRKLRYKENLRVIEKMVNSENTNGREGFIKADQLYYFDKCKIDYYVFGYLNKDLLDDLLQLILLLSEEGKLKYVTSNLEDVTVE